MAHLPARGSEEVLNKNSLLDGCVMGKQVDATA